MDSYNEAVDKGLGGPHGVRDPIWRKKGVTALVHSLYIVIYCRRNLTGLFEYIVSLASCRSNAQQRDLGIRNVLLISVQPTVALFSVYCKRQLSSY
jgi:hypothetical protein